MDKLYIMYLRKSRSDVDEGVDLEQTLARHKDRLNELCGRLGISCCRIIEEVVSADSIASRPGMIELLSLVETGDYEGVVCTEMSRLSRGDGADQALVINTFKYSNTKIITPQKTYDFSLDSDETYAEFDLFFSKNEYRTIKRRLAAGKLDSVSHGKFIGFSAPYGYEKYRLTGEKGFSLRIVEDEARIVRQIFDMYTQDGIGESAIATRLNALGVPNGIGRQWQKVNISHILHDQTYLGKIVWGRRPVKKKVVGGSVVRTRETAEPSVYDGIHQPIIDEEVFSKAQDIAASKQIPHLKNGTSLRNPLGGLLKCSVCGKTMILNSHGYKGRHLLYCPEPGCGNKPIYLDLVEDRLLEALGDWMKDYEVTSESAEDDQKSVFIEDTINILTNDIKSLKKQMDKVYDLFERDVYDEETFRERTTAIRCAVKEKELMLEKQREELSAFLAYEDAKKQMVPTVRSIIEYYHELPDATEKNRLLKEVIDHISYTKTETTKRGREHKFSITIYPKYLL